MIGRLSGKLIETQPPFLMLDVAGVGYEVFAPMTTFYRLPPLGSSVALFTQLVVREDSQTLYGFINPGDKTLFQILIKANGVGPKLALAIMSGIGADEFVSCIHDGDSAALVRIPGIGKKTAERLVIDLADRLKDWEYSRPYEQSVAGDQVGAEKEPKAAGTIATVDQERSEADAEQVTQAINAQQLRKDAESALMSLGYKPQDAAKAIKGVWTAGMSREELIRQALQSMVKRTVSV